MFAIPEARTNMLILAIILLNPFNLWNNAWKKKWGADQEHAACLHGLSLSYIQKKYYCSSVIWKNHVVPCQSWHRASNNTASNIKYH